MIKLVFLLYLFKHFSMKNIILFIAATFLLHAPSMGQMSLAHIFTKPFGTQYRLVNLSLSGKKYMTLTQANSPADADSLYFYNLDFSFWKLIPCPSIPGYTAKFNIEHDQGMDAGVFYPSETLFNLDTFLEAAVLYTAPGVGNAKYLIINENGIIVDSILNVDHGFPIYVCRVDTLSVGCQAIVNTTSGVNVYNLPGTLPCDACSNSLGYALNVGSKQKNFSTDLMPNPSSTQVKITFKLPDGVKFGDLCLYNTNGQKLKEYKVDNRFGYILLDNSELPPGLYYYNIVANGEVSLTQKMVVIK